MAATHGATKGPRGSRTYSSFPREYRSWLTMRRRCSDPKGIGWKHYGGRGITVCPRWASDYRAFLAEMGTCPEGHTLDRIDPNGNYEPGNCRWADTRAQRRNTRITPRVVLNGELLPLAEACERAGVNRGSERTIRLRYKLSHQEAFDRLRGWTRRVAEVEDAALLVAA